jgi:hypothetical protein
MEEGAKADAEATKREASASFILMLLLLIKCCVGLVSNRPRDRERFQRSDDQCRGEGGNFAGYAGCEHQLEYPVVELRQFGRRSL